MTQTNKPHEIERLNSIIADKDYIIKNIKDCQFRDEVQAEAYKNQR